MFFYSFLNFQGRFEGWDGFLCAISARSALVVSDSGHLHVVRIRPNRLGDKEVTVAAFDLAIGTLANFSGVGMVGIGFGLGWGLFRGRVGSIVIFRQGR